MGSSLCPVSFSFPSLNMVWTVCSQAIADTPSFVFLWVGDGVGLEQGRQCLKKVCSLNNLRNTLRYWICWLVRLISSFCCCPSSITHTDKDNYKQRHLLIAIFNNRSFWLFYTLFSALCSGDSAGVRTYVGWKQIKPMQLQDYGMIPILYFSVQRFLTSVFSFSTCVYFSIIYNLCSATHCHDIGALPFGYKRNCSP